jgi:hypothetical protein
MSERAVSVVFWSMVGLIAAATVAVTVLSFGYTS